MLCDTLDLRGRVRSSITVELRKRMGHGGRRTTINQVLRQVQIPARPYDRNIVKLMLEPIFRRHMNIREICLKGADSSDIARS